MPEFYHKNLGQSRQNQLWLVTHSDALLRHAVGISTYSVFHMSPADGTMENQLTTVLANDELESATLSLVGGLGDISTAQQSSPLRRGEVTVSSTSTSRSASSLILQRE